MEFRPFLVTCKGYSDTLAKCDRHGTSIRRKHWRCDCWETQHEFVRPMAISVQCDWCGDVAFMAREYLFKASAHHASRV